MNVHPPEEVCVPLCQMLSCLDRRPLKQTETSRLIIGFHVAWFCKCSFHLFSLFKVRQIYRNQGFVLFSSLFSTRDLHWPTVHELPGLPGDTFSLFLFFPVMAQCRYQCFLHVCPSYGSTQCFPACVRIQTLCNVRLIRLMSASTHIDIVG